MKDEEIGTIRRINDKSRLCGERITTHHVGLDDLVSTSLAIRARSIKVNLDSRRDGMQGGTAVVEVVHLDLFVRSCPSSAGEGLRLGAC